MYRDRRYVRHAFTLLELSIMLTIIGLIVGGILLGQNLLHTQKVRSALSDATMYEHVIQLFNRQYGGLPGDLRDAERVWGNVEVGTAADTDCTAPNTIVSSGNATCNGDGNGVMTASGGEIFRAWQQLKAAQYIPGSFTGVSNSVGVTGFGRDAVPGINVPTGAVPNSGYSWDSLGLVNSGVDTNYYDGDYDNMLVFGAIDSGNITRSPILTGKESFEVDGKIDDGLPGLGNVRSYKPTSIWANCTVGTDPATAVYNKSYNSAAACPLIFMWTIQTKTQQ